MSLGVYRHTSTRDLYVIEHADSLCVYGQREFDRDGSMRPWSTRLANFRATFRIDVDMTIAHAEREARPVGQCWACALPFLHGKPTHQTRGTTVCSEECKDTTEQSMVPEDESA